MNYFVNHTGFGLGKTVEGAPGLITVKFFTGEQFQFDSEAFAEGVIKRVRLARGTRCESPDGLCAVEEAVVEPRGKVAARYRVVMDNGLRAEVSEEELVPTATAANASATTQHPIDLLSDLDHGSYKIFVAREQLVDSVSRLVRSSGGLSSLHSSRIDLRPHQAYVAGVVLLDPRRRYLLADEVGLGKTIEAGIIIHDLLHRKPNARVLVVCPPALTQQWLCELYSKFSGPTFVLPELRPAKSFDWSEASRVIVGFTDFVCYHADNARKQTWDLVVIDEVHHLVDSEGLYDGIFPIACETHSLLLLSALPARRREDELLRLLRLLEPDRYADITDDLRRQFIELFESQTIIGRKLNLLKRRLDGLPKGDFIGEFTIGDAREKAEELLGLPVLSEDAALRKCLPDPSEDSAVAEDRLRQFMRQVAERYRINRRILRNRRENLIAQDELQPIQRRFVPKPYQPDQIEIDVLDAVQSLIEQARLSGLESDLLELLTQVLWQSLVTPSSAETVVGQLQKADSQKLNGRGRSYLRFGHLTGYAGWVTYLGLLAIAVKPAIPNDSLSRLIQAVGRWSRQRNSTRFQKLKEVLQNVSRRQVRSRPKMIIFAGFPGLAAEAAQFLRGAFGEQSVGEFRWDMEREVKELSVREFRQRPERWLLVCDETGGEGRNFQFADELVQLDTPWQISRVEQRIGRLDRLGREEQPVSDVVSNVIYCDGSIEAGLVSCFAQGLGVYERSISGLEFSLRKSEQQITDTAASSGLEGLLNLVPALKADAESERVRDEGEVLLDEASFNRASAQAFRRVKNARELERSVEDAFRNYVELIGKKPIEFQDEEFPGCIYKFRTDGFHKIQLSSAANLGDACVGTFRREVAQQRHDLQFFTVGNPLFDEVYRSCHEQPCGRTYAIEATNLLGTEPWGGFEFVFVPEVKGNGEASSLGLFNRLESLLVTEPLHVFCGIDGRIPDTQRWLELRRSLVQKDKDFTWSNLTKDKASRLQDAFEGKWTSLVQELARTAEHRARQELEERLATIIDSEVRRLNELIEELMRRQVSETEVGLIRGWQLALTSWSVRLDSVGFLSINGWLAQRGST